MPSRAWVPTRSFFAVPYTLSGAIPQFASNTVGLFGAILTIWGLAGPGSTRFERLFARAAVPVGVATVIAAQYRTGIIGVLLAGGVVLWFRGRYVVTLALVIAGLTLVGLNAQKTFLSGAETVINRGQSADLVHSLDSRTTFWSASIPLIKQRPLQGWGLNVGSRMVLASLGRDDLSTIHGTWVEAVLGTGLVGAGLLGLALLSTLRRAWAARRSRLGLAVLGILVVFVVRSLTGSTIELYDIPFLIFGSLLVMADTLARTPRESVGEGPTRSESAPSEP